LHSPASRKREFHDETEIEKAREKESERPEEETKIEQCCDLAQRSVRESLSAHFAEINKEVKNNIVRKVEKLIIVCDKQC